MNHVNLFLILVIILVILLFVLVILFVAFREGIEEQCCSRGRRSNSSEGPSIPRGLRNPAFDDQEHPCTVQQRPFSNMEATECPPSYEEAIKQELFRFRLPTPLRTRSCSTGDIVSSRDRSIPSTSFAEEPSVVDSSSPPIGRNSNLSQPSTSHSSRSRSSTVNSSLASHLSTIEEEDNEDSPVTVVIDCIGIQAARLMEKCDTSVDLADGGELGSHSKC